MTMDVCGGRLPWAFAADVCHRRLLCTFAVDMCGGRCVILGRRWRMVRRFEMCMCLEVAGRLEQSRRWSRSGNSAGISCANEPQLRRGTRLPFLVEVEIGTLRPPPPSSSRLIFANFREISEELLHQLSILFMKSRLGFLRKKFAAATEGGSNN